MGGCGVGDGGEGKIIYLKCKKKSFKTRGQDAWVLNTMQGRKLCKKVLYVVDQ